MTERIKHLLNDKRRDNERDSIKDAIKRAKQYIRNVGVDDSGEPEGFGSGDMKTFLENPDKYDTEDDVERKKMTKPLSDQEKQIQTMLGEKR